jgi:hypothetical protein
MGVVSLFSSNDTVDHVSSFAEGSNLLFHGDAACGRRPSTAVTVEHGLLLVLVVLNTSRNESPVGSLQSGTLAALFTRLAECAADSASRLGAEASYAAVDVGNGNAAEKSECNGEDAENHNDGMMRRRWWWRWVALMSLSAETLRTVLGLVMVRPVRAISVMRRRRWWRGIAMVRITRARRTVGRGRMTSREGERMAMVRGRRWGRSMRRTVVRRMRARVSAISVVRAVVRAMVRWMRMSEDVIVESMSSVSHAILDSVQNTLDSIAILNLLVGRGGRGRILLAQLLSNGRLPLLDKLLKLENLLVKSFQFHQLNLKLLFRVLELAVGALPDRGWVVGGGLVTC